MELISIFALDVGAAETKGAGSAQASSATAAAGAVKLKRRAQGKQRDGIGIMAYLRWRIGMINREREFIQLTVRRTFGR
jgi:hypothetical protein